VRARTFSVRALMREEKLRAGRCPLSVICGRPGHRVAPNWRLAVTLSGGRLDPDHQIRGELTMPHTVTLHRVLTAPPEKVYRAFIEPDALAKWIPAR
jgi:hypothetical protein